jgi:hypothetical protein
MRSTELSAAGSYAETTLGSATPTSGALCHLGPVNCPSSERSKYGEEFKTVDRAAIRCVMQVGLDPYFKVAFNSDSPLELPAVECATGAARCDKWY